MPFGIFSIGSGLMGLSTYSSAPGREVSEMQYLIIDENYILFTFFTLAFRMIPYPLEKGHLFYPYPSCTEAADRELLPS